MCSMVASGLLLVCLVLVVGQEAVLAGSTRELHCGRRLVSGLFSRPRLPLGYTYVATVPRGACRLNVSEITGNENYIALKILNGSFIINGEFAVSSPGNYEAAGARFLYTRAEGLDQVYAVGPILQPIDIMILYTQPNPTIKYEYFTESLNDDVDVDTPRADAPDISPSVPTKHQKHNPRHKTPVGIPRHPDIVAMSKELEDTVNEYVVGERKFVWKIVSYTQCTRTCGGGIQLGKYRCVETSASSPDKEVSSVHCTGSPPLGRRRRCGNGACPPRWRAAAWSSCPKCGPATRKRIVGCVQDHSRGITKISDQKCPPLKPHTSERCNVPSCDEVNIGIVPHIVAKPRANTDTFRDGPVYTVTVNGSDADIGPEYSFGAVGGWLWTDWSECVGWCVGGGVRTRGVRCTDPSGCLMQEAPASVQTCTPKHECAAMEGNWFVGEWSPCSSKCNGKQIRGVLCVGGTGRHLRDAACAGARPPHERPCSTHCAPAWYYSEWDKCVGNCSSNSVGLQKRSVVCGPGDSKSEVAVTDTDCSGDRPSAHRTCALHCDSPSTLPPDLTIESQKASEPATTTTTTQKVSTRESVSKGCKDKLPNCSLAVQARLCHYNFYIQNCCNSCRGR